MYTCAVLEILLSGLGGTAVGSLFAGYFLLRLQHRRELRTGGDIEVVKSRRVEQDQVLRTLSGLTSELNHCLMHVLDDGRSNAQDYVETGLDFCAQSRQLVRRNVELVGQAVLDCTMQYTDLAKAVLEGVQPPVPAEDVKAAINEQSYRLSVATWATRQAPQWGRVAGPARPTKFLGRGREQ